MNDKYKKIPFFCIHLLHETNRENSILKLKNDLELPIQVIEAVNGQAFLNSYPNFPRRHPFEIIAKERGIPYDHGKFISNPGEVGCLLSHISILYHASQKNLPFIGIFEDDTELLVHPQILQEFLEKVDSLSKWDFLILGANEWVQSFPVDSAVQQIQRFWGTHALILSQKAIHSILTTHKQLQMEGFAYPADWLYAKSIQEHKLTVYGPTEPKSLFRQIPGFLSAINGKVR
jgi:GR25 family glycosyltransferase involved in LPS biosynthesis